ncbi:MAG: hypothetical protein QS721_01170 [Candidatus Endonucleobacter sp. (ex Gigantidas childressi)]|nr:hypothetical protein [Candidatus Endonucleobacter sp. (ex Gigantidas childressi)]
MDWRDQMIADAGRGMGLEELDFSGSGVIKLEFERRGDVYIETREDGVLFYLIRKVSSYDRLEVLTAVLQSCHYSQSTRFTLLPGMQGDDDLFLCSFLINESFSRPNIEGVIKMMGEQFDNITSM